MKRWLKITIPIIAVILLVGAFFIIRQINANSHGNDTEETDPPVSSAEEITTVINDNTNSPDTEPVSIPGDITTAAGPDDTTNSPEISTAPETDTKPIETTSDEAGTTEADVTTEANPGDITTGPDETTADYVITTGPEQTTEVITLPCEHTPTVSIAAQAATCTADGNTEEIICSKCMLILTKSEKIPKFNHTEGYIPNSNGTHKIVCTRCNTVLNSSATCTGGSATCTKKAVCKYCRMEYGTLAAHSYTQKNTAEQYLKSKADCEHAAVYYYSCKCGAKGSTTFEDGLPKGHTEGYVPNGDGTHKVVCTVCNSVLNSSEHCTGGTATCKAKAICQCCRMPYGELGGHTESEWIVDKPATSTADGEKHTECTVCKTRLKTERIAKGEHVEHTWVCIDNGDRFDSRCGVYLCNGTKVYKCSVCGEEKVDYTCDRRSPEESHNLVYSGRVVEATCDTKGGKVRVCTKCGCESIKVSDSTPQLAHASVGHTYGAWTTTRTATADQLGLEQRVCTVCGHVEKRFKTLTGEYYEIEHQFDLLKESGYVVYNANRKMYTIEDHRSCSFEDRYLVQMFLTDAGCTYKWVDTEGKTQTAFASWADVPNPSKYCAITLSINADGTYSFAWQLA